VYRIARGADAWRVPDWAFAGQDGTFGNRFDDPKSTYRVLYGSSQRLGCFIETLARFRLDLKLYAELEEIEGENDFVQMGSVPGEWLSNRLLASARVTGDFADICGSEWMGRLRPMLASLCIELNIAEVDASVLQQSGHREITQRVSRIVYEYGAYTGLRYLSKHGHDIETWAMFEPFRIEPLSSESIGAEDPDFLRALRILNLQCLAGSDDPNAESRP
jgi:hypothetical protein